MRLTFLASLFFVVVACSAGAAPDTAQPAPPLPSDPSHGSVAAANDAGVPMPGDGGDDGGACGTLSPENARPWEYVTGAFPEVTGGIVLEGYYELVGVNDGRQPRAADSGAQPPQPYQFAMILERGRWEDVDTHGPGRWVGTFEVHSPTLTTKVICASGSAAGDGGQTYQFSAIGKVLYLFAKDDEGDRTLYTFVRRP